MDKHNDGGDRDGNVVDKSSYGGGSGKKIIMMEALLIMISVVLVMILMMVMQVKRLTYAPCRCMKVVSDE